VEISKQQTGDVVEVRVKGRLDAYWADHLTRGLEEVIRDGADRIRLNMAEVSYMSSVGIRVLLKFYKQLQRLQGSFAVSNPSDAVKTVLELAGLEALLAAEAPAVVTPAAERPHARLLERAGAAFEVFDLNAAGGVRCHIVGSPEALNGARFEARHCHRRAFPESTFGVGLGAFGADFHDCRARFGEFVVVAGAAAYLPTDGTNVPDYVVAAGALVPELNLLYGLICEGSFAWLTRFEAKGGGRAVALNDVAAAALDIAEADTAGIVLVGESAGLMGAALRRSPALEPAATAPFTYPQIRDWLSFTPERAFPRSVALVVGVLTRAQRPELAPFLRPLGTAPDLAGHFHAAAFSYRPLQKGRIELRPTVAALFEAETLQGVLHLLNDDRAIVGTGQSEFVRGACWIAAVREVVRAGD
jgi:anti-anti-sigma factor